MEGFSAARGVREAGGHVTHVDKSGRRAINSYGVLPSISTTVAQQSPRKDVPQSQNPLALNTQNSKAKDKQIMTQERWRSMLLQYEVSLRELVTNSIDEPPSGLRIMKTFKLYDNITRAVAHQSPDFAEMLKLLRVEFCRSIFAQPSLFDDALRRDETGGDQEEELGTAYFDQVEVLLRENAALRVEVDLGNTRDNLAQLKRQVEKMQEKISYYENEVSRLERENERYAMSYVSMRDELKLQREKNTDIRNDYDDMKLRLLQENKELYLRVCRLRKHLNEKNTVLIKDVYKAMKDKRVAALQKLFEEGDERVVLLVMISQLEERLNELLDQYDKDLVFSDEDLEYDECRRQLKIAALLIEEMHLCERRYLDLLPQYGKGGPDEPDETDVFSSLISEPRMYEALVARIGLRCSSGSKTQTKMMRLSNVCIPQEDPSTKMTLAVYKGQRAASPTLSNTQLSVQMSREPMDDTLAQLPRPNTEESILGKESDQLNEPQFGLQNSSSYPGEDAPQIGETSGGQQFEKRDDATDGEEHEEVRDSKPKFFSNLTEGRVSPVALPGDIVDEAKSNQERWVTNLFGTATEANELMERIRQRSVGSGHLTKDETLLQNFIQKPMLDISTSKFNCGVDVFTGPGQHTQALLCSVNYIDPVEPIAVPRGTNYMHLKHRNTLRQEVISSVESASSLNQSSRDAVDEWGGKSAFCRGDAPVEAEQEDLADMMCKQHIFGELKAGNFPKGSMRGVAAFSSAPPSTAMFFRLNPVSPNRSPEWLLYQKHFGGYRPITPRLIDISTIGYILLNACERHFEAAEERYMQCVMQMKSRANSSHVLQHLVEGAFRDAYVLTDFQESLMKELEARYCYPELVAKTMYEILCYFDATMSSQPLVDLLLSCIRGFESPTRIHYITYVIHQLSTNWPSSNPEEAVAKEDVLTLLEHLYRRASGVINVAPADILSEYQLATHSAPITLSALRSYIVTATLHYEDPLLLYYNGFLSYRATSNAVVTMDFEQFESVLEGTWEELVDGKLFVRYLVAGCGFNKSPERTTKELACVAASMWCSRLWKSM